MSYRPTQYIESNALLNVEIGAYADAYDMLGELLPGEVEKLKRTAEVLALLCYYRAGVRAKGVVATLEDYGVDLAVLAAPRPEPGARP